jgi:hypothetical protein
MRLAKPHLQCNAGLLPAGLYILRVSSKDGFTIGLCCRSLGLTNFYPKMTIQAVLGSSSVFLYTRLVQQVTQGCSNIEMAFVLVMHITIGVNLVKQVLSHLKLVLYLILPCN